MDLFHAIAPVAARQHGLFSAEQAAEQRVSHDLLRRELRRGRLVRLRLGIYAVSGSPATWERSVMAAVLAAGGDAVASHTTAAVVWQLPNVSAETTEVSTDRPRRARLQGIRVHRSVAFLDEEHAVHNDIPVTSVARTIVDLSARLSILQLGIATDDALRRNILTLNELRRCVGGLAPGPGRRTARIHELLAVRLTGYDPGDSELEMRVLRAIVAAGLPEPVQQHELRLPTRRCRIDLAYPGVRLAIEVDGFGPHTTRTAFDRDRARANDLTTAGWSILRFTSASTDRQIRDAVAASLTRLGRSSA